MKHGIHILFWMLIAALSSCTDDEIIDVPEPQPQTGIVIRLSAGDLEQTRTELTSQANLQHVEKVYALLYRGHYKEGLADTTKLIACDELTDWNPEDEGNGGPHGKEYKLPKTENLPQGNYTVLCIGLDDNDEAPNEVGGSGKTYNLPEAIKNKTLSEAKATLAEGKGKEDIAKSELFAGWNQFHFAPDSLNIVDVEMKRRVAGVLCYLTDVPYQLTQDNKTYRITSVELWLYTKQNTGIKLCREEITGSEYPEDFGDTSGGDLEGSELIGQQSMINSGFDVNTDKTLYTRNKQTITTTDGREVTIKENSILMGAYLIPIDYDGTKSTITDANLKKDVTLQVALRGVEVESIEENITDEQIEEAQIVRSFPAFNDDIDLDIDNSSGTSVATPSYTYPIRPNIIYHIGNKPSDEEEGTPESLAGTEVKIGVKCWENENVDVEFPSVPISFGMEIEKDNLPYKTEPKSSEDNEYYIFDCVGSDEYCLHVKSSVLYKKWVVTVAPVVEENVGTGTDSDNMIYFKQVNDESDPERYDISYTHTDESLSEKSIPIVITDYVDISGKPTRKIRISVVGLKADEQTPDEASRMSMTVEQYNAIIVDNCAYSWFDVGVQRNRENGTIVKEADQYVPWNYYLNSWYVDYIYGDRPSDTDGQYNSLSARKQATDKEGEYKKQYTGSALEKGYAISVRGSGDFAELKKEEGSWFLPAKDQLKSFMNLVKSDVEKYHITKSIIEDDDENEDCYWSSTAGSGMRFSHAIRINQSNEVEESHVIDVSGWKGYRTYKYRIRRARNLN